MAKRNTTKLEIIQLGTHLFLEKGYSATAPKLICEAMEISTGNLTYYFPTKEHLLAVLVHRLCDFQFKIMEAEAEEGLSSVMAVCLEIATMAAICEEDEIARDFYLAAYSSPLSLGIIRENDTERAKLVFKDYCSHWSHEQFAEAEILVSGIEHAILQPAGEAVPLEARIAGAIDVILSIFSVPEELRKTKIERVLSMDYRRIGRRILKEFKEYVEKANEEAFHALKG